MVARPDVVLVSCGGRGGLAGVAAALKLTLGSHTWGQSTVRLPGLTHTNVVP